MGAVMPSGRVLARTMAQYVDTNSESPVVELGPGTGAITNALIEHGVDQKRLVLVEYNPGFCALLRDRYPHAKVVQGDAYKLRDSLWDVLNVPASAVVSGLPLVTKPMLTRLKLIRDAFLALAPGAPFVLRVGPAGSGRVSGAKVTSGSNVEWGAGGGVCFASWRAQVQSMMAAMASAPM